ncbi:hypothetical protein BEWA_034800 [Theileria equi strain WA]|uniref:Uncharacterized protein n=1 Tax=Theileria equi strain WA TaxID=1537102 RepID=L1LDU0_THEEQ|nr:hypothetical protein BEWA_034800 [Theileria equi strain WA]EKX73444.1 hypothetical protein BEWA_034800 [Theileria equi strain WA]|eukprot:XP_004832896.1 hypothetical protein BEWA_034800 [Theileria equi strain WA]
MWNYVYLDISKDTDGKDRSNYKDQCGCIISLTRTYDPKLRTDHNRLTGYKVYTHTLPSSLVWRYYLGVINYKSIKQEGLGGYNNYSNSKYVSVFYWRNDDKNLLPLLIGINIGGKQKYFTKQNINNEWWKKYNKSPYSPDFHFKDVLDKTFNKIVILNLNADASSSYCGHPSKEDFKKSYGSDLKHANCEYITISVTWKNNTPCQGYVAFTHYPDSSSMRILSTWHSNKFLPFENNLLKSQYELATVYYAESDDNKKHPLLVELKKTSDLREFYEPYGNTWKQEFKNSTHYDSQLKTRILKTLDKYSCKLHDAIPVNISKKSGSYYCEGNCSNNHRINLGKDKNSNSGLENYEAYTHTLLNGISSTISRFRNENENIILHGLLLPIHAVTQITVYFPTCTTKSIPILINISNRSTEKNWYRRESKERPNEWIAVESVLDNIRPNDEDKEIIITVLNEIVKDLGIEGCKKNLTKAKPNILPPGYVLKDSAFMKTCGMDIRSNCDGDGYDDDSFPQIIKPKKEESVDSLEVKVTGEPAGAKTFGHGSITGQSNTEIISGGGSVSTETIVSMVDWKHMGAGTMHKVEDTVPKRQTVLTMTGSKDTISFTTPALLGTQGGGDTIIVGDTTIYTDQEGTYKARLPDGSEALVIVTAPGKFYAVAAPPTAELEGSLQEQSVVSSDLDTAGPQKRGEDGDSGQGVKGKAKQEESKPGNSGATTGGVPDGQAHTEHSLDNKANVTADTSLGTEAGTTGVSGSSDGGSPPQPHAEEPPKVPQQDVQSNTNAKNTQDEGGNPGGAGLTGDRGISGLPGLGGVLTGTEGEAEKANSETLVGELTGTTASGQSNAQPFISGPITAGGLAVLTGAGTYGGPLAGAGGLTGLGWWAYKSFKKDPWVRQI